MPHAANRCPRCATLVGHRDRALQLGGLAQQGQQLVGRPQAAVIWSMTPQGAPTTRFSTFWHSSASSRGSSAQPEGDRHRLHGRDLERRRRADALALRDVRADQQAQRPTSNGNARSRAEHHEPAHHVGGPLPGAVARQERPRVRVLQRSAAGGQRVERRPRTRRPARWPRHPGSRPARAARGRAAARPAWPRERPLEHERARVVGDAAHDVQPPGRPGHARSSRSRSKSARAAGSG